MSNESNKIIVKVGKKSNVRFSNSKVFRAITLDELSITAKRNDDCHIVIVEGIESYEEEALKKFITDFKSKNEINEVLFFIPDNDEVTSGVADELDYNIYLKLEDLYNIIYETFNINVSTLIEDKQKYNSAEMQEDIDGSVPDLFGSLNEEDETQLSNDLDAVTEEKTDYEKSQEEHTIGDELAEQLREENQKAFDESSESEDNTSESEDEDSELITKLKMQLRDAKYDYSVVVKDMREANSKIDSLEDMIRALSDEKQTLLDRFNSLVETTEVLEDPISLSEYKELNELIESNENTIKDLSATIESLNATIEEREASLEEKKQTIEELRQSISELNDKLSTINATIESGEIHKEVVEEYEEKIKQVNDERDKLIMKLNTLQSEINALYGKIDDLSHLADTESVLRLNTLDKLTLTINKLVEYKKKLVDIENEKNQLQNNYDSVNEENEQNKQIIEGLQDSVEELENKVNDAERRIELSENYSNEEKNKLQDTITELTTKLNVTEEQLQQKEQQYIQLVSTSGIDANGASALVETNKQLEGITRSLREQLGTVNKENDALKKKSIEANAAIESYKGQVNQLNNTLKEMALAGGTGGGVSVGAEILMKPINYTGQATILPVFGSGSFGITTMAMSLASKLCITSRVLYLDFDMVLPKADAWFGKLPLCVHVPGVDPRDRRMTGLGIFYELGLQAFMNNFENIVNHCDKTKGGGIDYISGVYYRVDNIKVTTADYTSLFNFLASRYQYIVVDLGRLGSSDVNDRLIKNITDIARRRSVCVTTCDIFEVRSFKSRLVEDNIDVSRLAWLLNMCNSTNIDEKIKKAVDPALYNIMLTDTSLYGVREKFTRNKLNKDKFELFLNSALFSN